MSTKTTVGPLFACQFGWGLIRRDRVLTSFKQQPWSSREVISSHSSRSNTTDSFEPDQLTHLRTDACLTHTPHSPSVIPRLIVISFNPAPSLQPFSAGMTIRSKVHLSPRKTLVSSDAERLLRRARYPPRMSSATK